MIKLTELLQENTFSKYSNDALADMIVNLSRYEGNKDLIANIKQELEKRKKAVEEKLDPVGKEDDDINNDGKVDKTDKYLAHRRKAISKNIKEGDDHEVAMAQASLKSIIKSAAQLMNKLGNMERDIPGWIQDHITNAENYIDQAAQGFHELNDNE